MTSSAPSIPVTIQVGPTGAVPTPPAIIWQNLVTYLQAENPGYTALPALLVEDLLSTAVAALTVADAAAVETINSLAPNAANPWLTYLLGQLYGVVPQTPTNTAVYVVFSSASIGYVIFQGFTVTDGTYQYVVQFPGGVIGASGQSAPLYAVATITGSFPVAPGTVTGLVTSVPVSISLTCTNPSAGIPSTTTESQASYLARVMQAGLATAVSTQAFAKTLLLAVAGVQPNLVSIKQVNGGGWECIVGGGDPYEVAYAILVGIGDVGALVGSTIGVTAITKANPGVVTTNLNHGLTTGQANVYLTGVEGMTGANGGPYTVTVLSPTTFSFGVNTTSFGTYTSGGVVTPNTRNAPTDVYQYPDTYSIPIVIPPSQAVTVQLTWNSNSPNFVSDTAVAQLTAAPIAAYIAGIAVGQPINLLEANAVFQAAALPLIPTPLISQLTWTITINGIETSPSGSSSLIYGDPESYFVCTAANVTVTQA